MDNARAHVIVSGMVQGVFFRADAREQARELSLTGWVKNCWGGNLEVVLEGNKKDIEKMIDWLHTGPPSARVEEVKVEWEEPTGEFDTFFVNY
ncbi:acylphosphatase [Candidatus Omnitrophota bacterium]